MSSKRRRINGFVPIDKLAGDEGNLTANIDGGTRSGRLDRHYNAEGSKRYKEYRKDKKIVDELNRLSTQDFLPPLSSSAQKDAAPKHSVSDEESIRDSSESEHEFEALEGTPPMKRAIKSSNGLLSSSPFDIWKNNSNVVITKFNIAGSLCTIDVRKKMDERSQCLLKFVNDTNGPRITFTHKNFDIRNSQIDFRKDCQLIIFDRDYYCMGMVLKEPRFIDMENKSKIGRVQTRLLVWVNSDSSKSNKIHKMKDILFNIKKFKIKVLENKKQLIKTLDDIAIQDYKNKVMTISSSTNEVIEKLKNRRHFWEKTDFKSLGVQNRLSNYKSTPSTTSSGQKIPIPKISSSPEVPSKENLDQSPIGNISPLKFYSNPTKDTSNKDFRSMPTHSALRKSSRIRGETPNLVQSTLWDLNDDKNFEKPETLEPSLYYKFMDGASYTITNQDFKCLYNHDWINDSILDFFTKYYAENSIANSIISRSELLIMSSFFYTKLISDPNDYYGNVKKWVTNSDLFRKKYVVIPININFHWFGCIITNLDLILDFSQKAIKDSYQEKGPIHEKAEVMLPEVTGPSCQGRNEEEAIEVETLSNSSRVGGKNTNLTEDEEVTLSTPIISILTFDSLRQTHTREIDPIKEFLIAYAKDKYDIILDKAVIKMKTCSVPQQPNMSDCGVHVILNNMKFFSNPKETIEVWRSAKPRNKSSGRLVNEYFEKSKRNTARKYLRGIILTLHGKQMEESEKFRNNDSLRNLATANSDNEDDEGDIEIIEDINEYKKNIENLGISRNSTTTPPPDETSHKALKTIPGERPCNNTEKSKGLTADLRASLSRDSSIGRVDFEISNAEEPPFEKVYLTSPRRYLESSPIKTCSNGKACDLTSPYFGSSSLRRRAETFEKSSPTKQTADSNDTVRSEHQRSLPSELIDSPSKLKVQGSQERSLEAGIDNKCEGNVIPSAPPERESNLSDSDEDRDEDVDLIGAHKKDTKSHIVSERVQEGLGAVAIKQKLQNLGVSNHRSGGSIRAPGFSKNGSMNDEVHGSFPSPHIKTSAHAIETVHSDEDLEQG